MNVHSECATELNIRVHAFHVHAVSLTRTQFVQICVLDVAVRTVFILCPTALHLVLFLHNTAKLYRSLQQQNAGSTLGRISSPCHIDLEIYPLFVSSRKPHLYTQTLRRSRFTKFCVFLDSHIVHLRYDFGLDMSGANKSPLHRSAPVVDIQGGEKAHHPAVILRDVMFSIGHQHHRSTIDLHIRIGPHRLAQRGDTLLQSRFRLEMLKFDSNASPGVVPVCIGCARS
jgi:hypothetical protein